MKPETILSNLKQKCEICRANAEGNNLDAGCENCGIHYAIEELSKPKRRIDTMTEEEFYNAYCFNRCEECCAKNSCDKSVGNCTKRIIHYLFSPAEEDKK